MQTRQDCSQEEDPGFLAEVALMPAPTGHWALGPYGFAGGSSVWFQVQWSHRPVKCQAALRSYEPLDLCDPQAGFCPLCSPSAS